MRLSPAPTRRLPPARLTRRRVSRGRVLLGRRPTLLSELETLRAAAAGALSAALGEDVRLSAQMADPPVASSGALGHTALLCLLALAGPGAHAVLELDPRLASALAARRTGASVPEVPVLAATRLERALLSELLLSILARLREEPRAESRWRPRLLEVGTGRLEAERRLGSGPALVLELGLESPSLRGRVVLLVPELALGAIVHSVAEHRAPPGPGPGHVRLGFSPRIRCGAVWPHELASLAGAAVALPGARLVDAALHGPVSLVRPGIALLGTLSAEGFHHSTVELRPPSQEVTYVDPALSELPVELEVELARVPLSLAELGALETGTLLPLRVRAGDPVFLRAGDRRIARAELVEVEGEVTARVLELVR